MARWSHLGERRVLVTNGATTGTVDADGEYAGVTFVAPVTGTIDRVASFVQLASDPQDMVTTIEGLDSSGLPDGSPLDTSDAWTPAAGSWGTATLSTGASVTKGTRYCVTHTWSSTTGNMRFCLSASSNASAYMHLLQKVGGSWSKITATGTIMLAVRYSDGTWEVPLYATAFGYAFTGAEATFNSGSNEIGLSFTPPVDCTFVGADANLGFAAGTTDYAVTVTLYDTDGDTALAAASFNGSNILNTVSYSVIPFGYVALTGGSTYYLGLKGTGAQNVACALRKAYSDALAAIDMGGLTDCAPLDRPNGGGTWSSYANYLELRPLLDPGDTFTTTPVYHADILYTRDETNSRDEITCVWFKNGVPQTTVATPLVQIIARADGSDLQASTAMTDVGSGVLIYNAGSHLIAQGEAAVVKCTATIDGAARTFQRVVSRDSAS